MRNILAILVAFSAGLLAAARPAHALDYCVNSVSDLRSKLALLQFSAGNHTIRLVQNLDYDLGTTGLTYTPNHAGSLSLLGGYTAGCAQRTINPSNTRLQGHGRYDTSIRLTLPGGGLIEGIQFTGLNGPSYRGGLQFLRASSDQAYRTLVFRHNIVNGVVGHTAFKAGYGWRWYGELRLENNLFQGNQAIFAASVANSGNAGSKLVLAHNTVYGSGSSDNAMGGLFLEAAGSPSPPVAFQNNILWANAGVDLVVAAGTSVFSDHNVIGTISGSTTLGSTTISADPMFVSPAAGNLRLQSTSPAINFGTNSVAGGLWAYDLDRNSRLVGTRPDAGAYESAVDDSGLQVVTTTADSGAGSLRQAIINANLSPVATRIKFDISTICPRVITLGSPLPDIAKDVFLDGYSEYGSMPNTSELAFNAKLCVAVRGNTTNQPTHALRVSQNSGRLRVSGIAFGNFSGSAIDLPAGSNHQIRGSQFGGSLAGSGLQLGAFGLDAVSIGPGGSGTVVGGSDLAARNVVGGSAASGIGVTGGAAPQIRNNLIGLDADGSTPAPNLYGVWLRGQNALVAGNVISGNNIAGIVIGSNQMPVASGNSVTGNRIGTYPNGTGGIGNGTGSGIAITFGATQNTVGGLAYGSNSIAFHKGPGVFLNGAGYANRIQGNSIRDNDRSLSGYPSIIFGYTPTPNDPGDSDDGSNRQQNFPELLVARLSGQQLHVEGDLDAEDDVYIVEIYAAERAAFGNNRGELGERIGYLYLTVAGGPKHFSGDFTVGTLPGQLLTAIAIRNNGDTSEPGPVIQVEPDNDRIFSDDFEL
ncbi:MAG: hypothetical protein KF811_05105 [Dokdonella sp.]|nr:hypothetical protein [Dokdonella sp.]